jgi:hypothetical protein
MKRVIIVVWRWDLNFLLKCGQEHESYIYRSFDIEGDSEKKLICIMQRDQQENSNQREKIIELITDELIKTNEVEYLVLLHGGGPDCYESAAVETLTRKKERAKFCLFSGEDDGIGVYYHSRKNKLGLIDTNSDAIHRNSLSENGEIKKANFEYVWNHYTIKKKIDNLHHVYRLKALVCKGILECLERKRYEEAQKYYRYSFGDKAFSEVLINLVHVEEKDNLERIKNFNQDAYDKITGWLNNKNFKSEEYEKLKVETLEESGEKLLRKYLDWFVEFQDELLKLKEGESGE